MSITEQPSPEKLVSFIVQEDPDLRDIVVEFVNELDSRVEEIRQAHEKLDWELLTTLAHRLKGAGGSYGYPAISQLCAEMEQNFRAQQAPAISEWLRQLQNLAHAAAAGLRGD